MIEGRTLLHGMLKEACGPGAVVGAPMILLCEEIKADGTRGMVFIADEETPEELMEVLGWAYLGYVMPGPESDDG